MSEAGGNFSGLNVQQVQPGAVMAAPVECLEFKLEGQSAIKDVRPAIAGLEGGCIEAGSTSSLLKSLGVGNPARLRGDTVEVRCSVPDCDRRAWLTEQGTIVGVTELMGACRQPGSAEAV